MKLTFTNIIQALACHVLSMANHQNKNLEFSTILSGTNNFIALFKKRLQVNGPVGTLARYKSIYSGVKSYVLGVKEYRSTLDPFISTNKHGVPYEVVEIIHLLSGESPWIRVILTVLRYFESIKLPVKFDAKPIIDEYKGKPLDPIICEFRSFLKEGMRKFGYKILSCFSPASLSPEELSFRFKGGPMGPSILTSHLCALTLHSNEEWFKIFKEYYSHVVSVEIGNQFMHSVKLCLVNVGNLHVLIPGKISLASEPAGKTRLFAICNFGVQTLLKPLHNSLMQSLKQFVSDGTFDQIGQFNRILKESKGLTTYCFDLTKATDRFPIKLQQALLAVLVSEQFAESWMKLISHLPFSYNKKYYYGKVGQPLGAFSSGAMFALTHHMVVQFCYYKAYKRINGFSKYALLGDDIAIWDVKVADHYLQFMSDIGVDINFQKSFVGLTNSGEFAKRHFYNGVNISGFGYALIGQARESLTGGIRFLEILELEGFRSSESVLLIPGANGRELSPTLIAELGGRWTLRNCFAHKGILTLGNIAFSYNDLMEYYILQRIELLNRQTQSLLRESDYKRLILKINKLSLRGGVAVKQSCLDISFEGNELVSHPLVRHLNTRNNIIFDKIQYFYELIQTGLYTQTETLKLSSYSQEEYIPSLTVDTFFSEDVNVIKHKLKCSTQNKAIIQMVSSYKASDTEGVNFHQS